MNIGDLVSWNGRLCYLRGVEPMSVPDRVADLEDARTAEPLTAPFGEVREAPREGLRKDP